MSLKYLSNVWMSLEMQLLNCKVKSKLKWTNDCVLSTAGADNDDVNYNDITFTKRETKLYILVVTLSTKENQKLSKLLSKGFERSVYWN